MTMHATLTAPVATLPIAPKATVPSPFRSLNRLARSVADAVPDGDLASRSKVALQAMAHVRGVPLMGKDGYAGMTRGGLIALLSDQPPPEKAVKPDSVADLRQRAVSKGLGKSVATKCNKAALTAYVVDDVPPVPAESASVKLRRIARERDIDGRSQAKTVHALVCLIRAKCDDADTLLASVDETKIAKAHESRKAAKATGLTATVCRQLIAFALESGRITKDDAKGRSAMKADDLRAFVERFNLHVPTDNVKAAA